jgi:hypothetical protein
MTLAAEAQQRAQMRQAAAAQQAMMQQQPQATVAEEQMAALGGISDLPAPNLENMGEGMAGGGIIAFAPGGDVGGLGAQYDAAKQAYAQSLENLRRYGSVQKRADPTGYEAAKAALQQAEQALQTTKSAWSSATQGMAGPVQLSSGVNPLIETATTPAAAATSGIAALADGSDNRFQRGPVVAGITDQPPAPDGIKQLAGKAGAGAPNMAGIGAAPSSSGYSDIFKDIDAQKKELMARAKEAEGIEAAGLEKERTALEAAKEEAKKYGTEQEEKYKKRGERLEKDEKQNPYMSLIEAGLAIAAGESPNALKNLAVGAQQGLKGYQARLEKVNEGRDNLDEAMFKLYNIRNDKVTAAGDKLRELNRAETKVKADAVRSLSEISKGMFGEEIKLKTKQIDQMFEMSKTRFEQGQVTERAKLTADRGDPVLRRAAYQGLQKELENNQRLLMAYSNNPEKAEAARQEIRRIKGEMDALLPGVGSSAGAGSGTVDMKNPLLGP